MIIKIKDLKVQTIIGVYKHEKLKKRPLVMNVEIETSLYKKGSDKLKDTLDYDQIADMLVKHTEQSRHNLIEKLADELLAKLLQFKGVKSVKLEIDKPKAIKKAQSVSVTVTS